MSRSLTRPLSSSLSSSSSSSPLFFSPSSLLSSSSLSSSSFRSLLVSYFSSSSLRRFSAASFQGARPRVSHEEEEDEEDYPSSSPSSSSFQPRSSSSHPSQRPPQASHPSSSSFSSLSSPLSSSSSLSPLDPASFTMDKQLYSALKTRFKIETFFPIQAECFEPIVAGNDLIGQSKTGTGKTLAFILPLIERLKRDGKRARAGEVTVLVMEPTRELAVQVAQEALKLSPTLRIAIVYGGAGFAQQTKALLGGVDLCVATPGRLQDLLNRGVCTLRATRSVVLDEADEMLRRGFREQIEQILSEKLADPSKRRQMLLFSATMPMWVSEISRTYQKDPLLINKVSGEGNATPSNLVHQAMNSPDFLPKKIALIGDLVQSVSGRVILFVNSKSEADLISSEQFSSVLQADAAALHGDVSQRSRDLIMADFKKGLFKLLIATDVAARGIDIPNVALVIQLGLPRDTSFYVHRSGRTARAGKEGKCIVLYRQNERHEVAGLGRETGVKFVFSVAPRINGESISAISGQLGFVTLESRGDQSANLTLKDFTTALTQLTGEEQVELGKSEFVSDGILVDVPQALADKALAALKVGKTSNISLSATTELPQDLLGNRKQYQGFASGGGGRAGGSGRSAFSSRGRGDSQGGRGSFRERSERPSFGGDRRGGRGGFGEDRPRRNYEDRGSLRRLDGDRRASSSSYGSSSGGREYKARREGSRESNFDPNSSH